MVWVGVISNVVDGVIVVAVDNVVVIVFVADGVVGVGVGVGWYAEAAHITEVLGVVGGGVGLLKFKIVKY